MEEIWKPLSEAGFERYEVSNLGRVRRGEQLLTIDYSSGTARVRVYDAQKKRKHLYLVTLVAKAFLDKPLGCTKIGRKNGTLSDNRASNLYWIEKKKPKRRTSSYKAERKIERCRLTRKVNKLYGQV